VVSKDASSEESVGEFGLREPEVVVFADGRIVTSSPEKAGQRVQSLGWAHRDIEIVGGLPAASGAWQRRRG